MYSRGRCGRLARGSTCAASNWWHPPSTTPITRTRTRTTPRCAFHMLSYSKQTTLVHFVIGVLPTAQNIKSDVTFKLTQIHEPTFDKFCKSKEFLFCKTNSTIRFKAQQYE